MRSISSGSTRRNINPWSLVIALALAACAPAPLFAQTPTQTPQQPGPTSTLSPQQPLTTPAPTEPSGSSTQQPEPGHTGTPPRGTHSRRTTPAAGAISNQPIGNDVILDNADHVFVDEETNDIVATDHIAARYRGYLMSADKATINTVSGVAVFSGHISLESTDKSTSAMGAGPNSQLTLNLRQGTYSLQGGASAVISPQELPQTGLLLPLRLFGGTVTGQPHVIDARDSQVTTCDFPNPHYAFGAKDMTIVPNSHLIARHVTLYRNGHPVITLPEIWLPISNRYSHQNLTPQLGYSPDEGYFAKFADPYVLAATALGVLRLDLMQYKGVGTGFDQSYKLHSNPANNQGGTISLYHLYDNTLHEDSLTGSWTHNQSLFDGFNLGLNSQYQQNSYFLSAGKSQTISSQLNLIRTTPDASTNFTTNWQENDFGQGLSSTLSSSLFQHEVLSKWSHLDFKLDFSQFQTLGSFAGSSSTSRSLTTNIDFLDNPKGYSFEFLIDKFNSLGATSSSLSTLSGVERLPEVKLQTDPAGQGKTLFDQLLPRLSRLLLDVGEFSEGLSGMHTNRLEFGLDLGNHSDRRGNLITTYNGQFQQYFYGDNTAQYILNGQGGYQYLFQKQSNFALKYSYLRPYGYTPFFFDRSGFYNNATATFNFNPSHLIALTAGTGYDFTQNKSEFGIPPAPWQNLLANVTVKPSKDFGTQLSATYDPNHGQFYDITDIIQAKSSSGFAFSSSASYVPADKEFSEIDSNLDLPIIVDKREDAGYRIQALEGYNGFTKTFTYQGVALTRSWHDWELSAIYENIPGGVRPGQTFYFNLRLKAFPGYQPFGVGAFGQGLSTGVGQIL